MAVSICGSESASNISEFCSRATPADVSMMLKTMLMAMKNTMLRKTWFLENICPRDMAA